ncbi:M23 family metallopeptidase [Novosphingobium beihaiensis]|uniref:M23 family metallopeptidase n=1 Tax=Novosphingobium beihaiensis TaxID=2930389 RepID=A0ABT0BU82_9SPHN|nr:M23 family metallopeptidase [Novosphingobium beihaiensis]MCJ2188582.1 M23 family metallopeptidase [Novosphingobium beihaiensis]
MVVTKSFAKFRAVASAFAAAGLTIAAHPAMANSSAAAADISAPLRAAQSASKPVSGGEDEQFRNLFSSWQNFEETGLAVSKVKPVVAGGIASVSIPSRNPLDHDVMTSRFGQREHPILGRRRMHKGVDLAAPIGTPVYAPADGVVSRASWFSSYGLYISLEHGGEMETRYGHLSRLNVAEGQRVHKGDVIGFVGSTGRSTGPHLHYEVRVDGKAVNPLPYMQSPSGLAAAEAAEAKEAKGG